MRHPDPDTGLPMPPGAEAGAFRLANRFASPIDRFLHIEASSGIVLLIAAVIALTIANSRWAEAYHHALEVPITFGIGSRDVEQPIHFWINDGLMTIFFFVVGLEIRREMHRGELSNLRRAALPVAAALGGMVVPALLYLLVAGGRPENRAGWGLPMATDIAFAVGVLALLGKRVAPALRVLLLALAIIDDIGGILVIAIFYSASLSPIGFGIAAAGVMAVLMMQRFGIRNPTLYVAPGVVIWFGFLRAGIHPTLAGIVVGLLTPARAWLGPRGLVKLARRAASNVEDDLGSGELGFVEPERLAHEAGRIDLAGREALAPAIRLQLALHPFVAFGVMPLFALANAGVAIGPSIASPSALTIGIVVGLVIGKPLGIVLASALAVRSGLATLPRHIRWREILVLGIVAGIGFTMALFIASLAFPEGTKLDEAKTAILLASALAIALGLLAGRLSLRRIDASELKPTAVEAESSDAL